MINLKALNQFVRPEHFKLEGLHLLPDLLQPGDWTVKMDLKDTYLQIPIHSNHQHLLQFIWEEKHYKFQCLPFGLTLAPRIFTKLLKPVVGFLRQIGLCLIVYLDDMLIMHANKDQLEVMAPLVCNFFEALGLMVNTKKSILNPAQLIVFGVPNQFSNNEIHPTIREVQKDTTGSSKPAQTIVNFSTAPSYICREGCCNLQSCCASPLTLQSSTESTQPHNFQEQPLEYSDRFDAQIKLDNKVMTRHAGNMPE